MRYAALARVPLDCAHTYHVPCAAVGTVMVIWKPPEASGMALVSTVLVGAAFVPQVKRDRLPGTSSRGRR